MVITPGPASAKAAGPEPEGASKRF